jgi:hypothetical protein
VLGSDLLVNIAHIRKIELQIIMAIRFLMAPSNHAPGQTKSAGRNLSCHMLVVAGYPERSQ